MNCGTANTRLSAYADGELPRLQRFFIAQHLRGCANCAARYEEIASLREQLRKDLPRFAAPAELHARARGLLGAGPAPAAASIRPTVSSRLQWLAGGALAGSMATITAIVAGNLVLERFASEDLVAEAVRDHVRASLDNRLIEVASSDRHAVKPWLSARLDYSPPVRDLSADGFTLIGGRLDSLGGRPVATLVYRYRLHTIDVFVRPEPLPAASGPHSLRGFNVARAAGDGMDYLAVSDVSPEILDTFIRQLAPAPTPQ